MILTSLVTDESGNRNNSLEAPATPGNLKLEDVKPESNTKIEAPTDEPENKQERHTDDLNVDVKDDAEVKTEPRTNEKPDIKEDLETKPRQTETMGELPKGSLRTPVTLLQESEAASRSGASTPGFVRTAAEVADSAALLDQEEPEPEITDEEAGRLGVR